MPDKSTLLFAQYEILVNIFLAACREHKQLNNMGIDFHSGVMLKHQKEMYIHAREYQRIYDTMEPATRAQKPNAKEAITLIFEAAKKARQAA